MRFLEEKLVTEFNYVPLAKIQENFEELGI
jgi:hypothetical protein